MTPGERLAFRSRPPRPGLGRAAARERDRGGPRRGLVLAGLLAALAVVACSRGPAVERVVLVTVDTLRADALGCYGGDPAVTPHLDALAARGARFETAISPAPLTLPSHATILTGSDPPEHGVHHNSVYRLREDVPTLAEALRAEGSATAAFVGSFVLDRRFGLARGFERYDDALGLERSLRGASSIAERPADRVVDAALAWLADAPPRFFLWVHLYDPHAAYHPPEPFATRFAADRYLGEVAFADAQLGRLLAALDARFPDGRTLVAVAADHGESRGEHGERTHSYTLYDATQHVPLILAGPGVPAGAVLRAPVRLADLAPTLLDLAEAPPLAGASGRSLRPLLSGEPDAERVAYLETLAGSFDFGWSPLYGVRTARYAYLRGPEPELYDLAADPGETTNLADQQPETVARLDRVLDERLTGRALAPPNLAPDAEARSQLESLGYVVPEPSGAPVLGRVGGPDPKRSLGQVRLRSQASALLAAGRPAEALDRLQPLADAGEESQLLRAMAFLGVGDTAAAQAAARRAIAAAPARAGGHLLLGRSLELEGRTADAERAYRVARAVEPATGASATALGRLAEARGATAEAEAFYRAGADARVPDAEAYWRLAALELERGETDAAGALLDPLPPQELTRPDAALRLAEAEAHAGRYELGLLRIEAGLRRTPNSDPLLAMKASLLQETGRLEESLAIHERLLAAHPESPAAANGVASDLARLGRDLERAERLARATVEATAGDPGALETLAAVQLARGDPSGALKSVERALPRAESGNRELLLLRRAEAQARLGRRSQAQLSLAAGRGESPPPGQTYADALARAEAALGDR
jgi:arylsulfatase A-like enzyme/Tfp pilus assembly protein PilF